MPAIYSWKTDNILVAVTVRADEVQGTVYD